MSETLQNGRSVVLDFLRGVAVLLILCRHHALIASGWIGVDMFFVLSGYLVSGLLFKEFATTNAVRPLRFWLRRGLKIYPLYYLFIGLTVGYVFIQPQFGLPEFPYIYNTKRLFGELFFYQNYGTNVWNHTWSLAVEEHFYLLLAVSFWWLARTQKLNNNILPIAIGAVCVVCLAGRYFAYPTAYPNRYWLYYTPTHLRLDALCAGVAVAWWQQYRFEYFKAFFSRSWLLVFALICLTISLMPIETLFMATLGLTVVYLSFAVILGCFVGNPNTFLRLCKLFDTRIINDCAWVGFYSYAIYLWHMPIEVFVFYPIHRVLGGNWVAPLTFPFFVALSLLVGWAMSTFVEQPILRFRDRWPWTR